MLACRTLTLAQLESAFLSTSLSRLLRESTCFGTRDRPPAIGRKQHSAWQPFNYSTLQAHVSTPDGSTPSIDPNSLLATGGRARLVDNNCRTSVMKTYSLLDFCPRSGRYSTSAKAALTPAKRTRTSCRKVSEGSSTRS